MILSYVAYLSMIAARTGIILLFLLAGIRLLGKRQLGQMNVYDLALIMALANAVQNAMTAGKGDLAVGLVSASTLLLIGWGATKLLLRRPGLEPSLVGKPTMLVHNGRVMADNLRRERVTEEELLAAVREHGIGALTKVRLATLEVDGTISIVPAEQPERRDRPGEQRR